MSDYSSHMSNDNMLLFLLIFIMFSRDCDTGMNQDNNLLFILLIFMLFSN